MFNTAFNILMKLEGGGKLHKVTGDSGGLTKFGISQNAYPSLDIASLTEDEAKNMYLNDYWNKNKCGEFGEKLAIALFCSSVNRGCKPAMKLLQSILNIKDDGLVGPTTINCAKTVNQDDLYLKFWNADYNKYTETSKIGDNKKFLAGWHNRLIKMAGLIGWN